MQRFRVVTRQAEEALVNDLVLRVSTAEGVAFVENEFLFRKPFDRRRSLNFKILKKREIQANDLGKSTKATLVDKFKIKV